MTAQSEAEKPFPKSGASFNPIQLPALGRGWAGPTHNTADDTDAGRGRPKMVPPFLHSQHHSLHSDCCLTCHPQVAHALTQPWSLQVKAQC